MTDKRIDQLREILAKAAARDEELQHVLETVAADLVKELGADAGLPVWAVIKAGKGERQVTEHFVMQDGWLRGDLVFEVTPEVKPVLNLRILLTRDKTHEVGLTDGASKSVIIDPPDEERRTEARKRFFEYLFDHLEGQVRQSVAFPAE